MYLPQYTQILDVVLTPAPPSTFPEYQVCMAFRIGSCVSRASGMYL